MTTARAQQPACSGLGELSASSSQPRPIYAEIGRQCAKAAVLRGRVDGAVSRGITGWRRWRVAPAIRLSLIRIALRPRDNIPELLVLALDQERATVDVPGAKRLARSQVRG